MSIFRLVEGEPLVYNGVLWLVKGFQHPANKVIAYPRYDLINKTKVEPYLKVKYINLHYWDCIKLHVPVIDLKNTRPFIHKGAVVEDEVISFLAQCLNINKDQLMLTGSSLIGEGSNDIDIVIVGADHRIIERLYELTSEDVLHRIDKHSLLKEYLGKHRSVMDLYTYLYIKGDTILHLIHNRKHINLKLVKYVRGLNECIDYVEARHPFAGYIEVIDSIEPYILPARFYVRHRNKLFVLETYREIFSELKPGKYFVRGWIEIKNDCEVLNIDHGFIEYVKK